MRQKSIKDEQGHWLLARMGKKVLRPGGKELTLKLIENLNIQSTDHIVEFAPGIGFTALIALKKNPKSYTGVELSTDAAINLQKIIHGKGRKIIVGNASESTLPNESSDKVMGEAMLTMQADTKKEEIIKEAFRILKKGGLYGIHELGLIPNKMGEEQKSQIQKSLSDVIKVNARPLTIDEWTSLLEKEGFIIKKIETNDMSLLEPKRLIDDEGVLRTFKIAFNILTHPIALGRIWSMRKVFRKYKDNLNAISIVAEKQ